MFSAVGSFRFLSSAIQGSIAMGKIVLQWTATGFGKTFSIPSELSTANAVSGFNNAGNVVLLPIINPDPGPDAVVAYKWDDIFGYGTKFVDPPSFTSSTLSTPSFSTADNVVSIGSDIYQWNNTSGFGTKYAAYSYFYSGQFYTPPFYKFNNFDNTVISYTDTATFGTAGIQLVNAFTWTYAGGVGTRYTSPTLATLTRRIYDVCIKNAATSSSTTVLGSICTKYDSSIQQPISNFYDFTPGTGFGTRYVEPNPFIGQFAPPFTARTISTQCKFTTAGDAVVFPIDRAAYTQPGYYAIGAYAWSGGFGTKYTNPDITPLNTFTSGFSKVSFTNDDKNIGFRSATTPVLFTYKWDSATGFGTRYSNPTPALTVSYNSLDFSL